MDSFITSSVQSLVPSEKMDSQIHIPNDIVSNLATSKSILPELMDNWGQWQLRSVTIIYMTKIFAAWFMACIIFTAPQPWLGEYKCNTSQYQDSTEWTSISHPNITLANGTSQMDYCQIILTPFTNASESSASDEQKLIPCETIKYNVHPYTSFVTQFDLTCSRSTWIDIIQSIYLSGLLIGTITAYELLNVMSPNNIMVNGLALLVPAASLGGLVTTFWLHIVFRFMSAICCAVSATSGGILLSHLTGGKAKTTVLTIFEQFWSVGILLLTPMAYYSPNWSRIYVFMCFPVIVAIILWNFVSDSPVWHMERNHIERIHLILKRAMKINQSVNTIPYNLDEILQNESKVLYIKTQQMKPQDNWSHLLSLPNSAWTVILLFTSWGFLMTTHYGILLNIKSFGRQYLFRTIPIAGSCEIIGGLLGLIVLLNFKNKWKIIGAFTFLCGVVSFAIWAGSINNDGSHMVLDLMLTSMAVKIGASAGLVILTVCTHELFPQPHKRRIVYGCSVVAGIMLISSPFIGWTIKYGDAVCLSIFSGMTTISGICILLINPIKQRVK